MTGTLFIALVRGDDGDDDDVDGLLFTIFSFISGVFNKDVSSESHIDDSTQSEHDECEHSESGKGS